MAASSLDRHDAGLRLLGFVECAATVRREEILAVGGLGDMAHHHPSPARHSVADRQPGGAPTRRHRALLHAAELWWVTLFAAAANFSEASFSCARLASSRAVISDRPCASAMSMSVVYAAIS